MSLGAGEVSWLKDNSVHWRRRWTLNVPVTKSTPENQPTSSLAVLGPVCLQHHPQQYLPRRVSASLCLALRTPCPVRLSVLVSSFWCHLFPHPQQSEELGTEMPLGRLRPRGQLQLHQPSFCQVKHGPQLLPEATSPRKGLTPPPAHT